MSIKEKLAKEDGTHMYCYKQGAFWVCYEQSAYIVSLSKAYKPSKKWIKNIAQEVVTIGFPNTALQQWVHEQGVKPIISTEVLNVFEWGNTFVAEGYVKWKNAIVLKENKTTLHRMHIEEEVKGFPLATCLLYKMGYFNSNIKKIILYKNLKKQHNKYLLR